MISELVRIHHAAYRQDLEFWIAKLEGLDPVLELGCGPGRLTLPLLSAGHEVYGLDLEQDSLQYAAQAARMDGLPAPGLIQADMLQVPLAGIFGGVVLPCNTFSTFPTWGRIQILKGVLRLIGPKGSFLASIPNPVLLERTHRELSSLEDEIGEDLETTFIHPGTGNPVQVSSLLSPGEDFLRWTWIYDHLQPDGHIERYQRETQHYLSSPEEYRQEIDQAGFSSCSFLGDYDGRPYQQDSPYLILICGRS